MVGSVAWDIVQAKSMILNYSEKIQCKDKIFIRNCPVFGGCPVYGGCPVLGGCPVFGGCPDSEFSQGRSVS